ncbi:cobalt-precorrin-5B (C(1))-methyltransferase CbiD [Chitinispirillales bacterium ANBcel5]|uniref:cobalt-precorrin-5B (C(1))-methyltransferase CbiD n=1 Tax=Cellulosispirillum alkaliphilum TaxID=3039283 RepID=UPI002A57E1A3|nr:cobalt-precorrin-5B (C(1))-methyltransferase CbiD [Chitinispirillales bacterium ANBcel5]
MNGVQGRGRTGYTTGCCAAAAAKAAALALCKKETVKSVTVALPECRTVQITIESVWFDSTKGGASVRKDAGDDPDSTHGMLVSVELEQSDENRFYAGEGVGTVTLPGLTVAVGEPAINSMPRQMIVQAIQSVTREKMSITVSIPGGEAVASRTFNPRLGIEGGLSILGTTGIVRPFSTDAIAETIRCSLSIAAARGVKDPVLVPGNIGRNAALKIFPGSKNRIVEVGNAWDSAMQRIGAFGFRSFTVVGHPGKLVKLTQTVGDTHSSRSLRAVDILKNYLLDTGISVTEDRITTEDLLLSLDSPVREKLLKDACAQIALSLDKAVKTAAAVKCLCEEVVLVSMSGEVISGWKRGTKIE